MQRKGMIQENSAGRANLRADRGDVITELFVCPWCGYSEEIEDLLEGSRALSIACSCCGMHEWESIEHR